MRIRFTVPMRNPIMLDNVVMKSMKTGLQKFSLEVILRILAVALLAAVPAVSGSAQEPEKKTWPLQHYWEIDPDFGDIWKTMLPERSQFVDLRLLESNQAQERLSVSQLICLNHDRPGFKDRERALKLLLEQIPKSDNPLLVKRSMLSAAALLDDGKHALELWDAAKDDVIAQSALEPFLAKWKVPQAREIWRKRLTDANTTNSDLILAIEGLGQTGEASDITALENVLRSNRSTASTRMLACRAMGQLSLSGLNELANQLLDSDVSDRDLLAASLIARHTDDTSLKLLQKIYETGSSPAQRISVSAIAQSHPATALDLAPKWLTHPDDQIRIAGLRTLQQKPTEERIRLQSSLFGDPSPNVRELARELLRASAEGDFKNVVNACVDEQLRVESWKALVQATILNVELRDQSRNARLIELLDHEQAEVNIHAGWALMELANDPTTLAAMVPHAQKITEQLEPGSTVLPKQDIIRLSYLFEAFGRNRYEPVLEMLYKYIPKDNFKMGNLSRCSAIWAIGKIKKEVDDPELRAKFRERITDLPPMNPEHYLVRYACILALGEFGYKDSKDIAGRHAAEDRNALGFASRWAIKQIDKAGK
jgi:hypothetical protein